MEYLLVDWKKLHNDVFKLSRQISKNPIKFDLIVTIARGGYCISHILSDLLSLPLTSFTVSSYRDLKQSRLPEITFKIGNRLHDKNILLIDDISDTGKTFLRGLKYLKSLGAENIKTASLFIKPWTKFTPDYYLQTVNQWIILPYEMRETVESLTRQLKKQKLTDIQLIKRLSDIGLPKKYINQYVK